MPTTETGFFVLNMKEIHDLVCRRNRWQRIVELDRIGYRDREGILLWGGGPDSGGRNPIFYSWCRYGSAAQMAGTIWTESVGCNFGGRRWYFLCPETGRRCQRLYLRNGQWVSRQAAGVTIYESQLSHEGIDRRYDQARCILRRLGVDESDLTPTAVHSKFPPRPPYMRWKRYASLCDDLAVRYWQRNAAGWAALLAIRHRVEDRRLVVRLSRMLPKAPVA